MPDISMCQNKDCPSRLKCYRYMAMPNEYRQAYMTFAPRGGAAQCEDFLPLYPEHQHLIDKYAAETKGEQA